MRDLGLHVAIDAIGNVVATRPGTDPTAAPVMTGSHIDTVATGGRFDGNLGVLAGLEVIETLEQHGVATVHPVAVGFFTDEEGARFAPDMLGSLVFVGGMALEEALDIRAVDDDARLGDELARIGYAGPLPCPTASAPHAYVELHIEQGPILEDEGITIGVVEGVQGISWTELTISGRSAHAGTTPMRLRRDAGYVAAAIAVHARRLATELGGAQVATVGRFEVHPDLVNVVPDSATLTVDLRNTDDDVLRLAEAALAAEVARLAAAEGVTVTTRSLARFEPVVVRRRDGRPGRGDGAAPRPLDATDAERRRPRRPDARPHLPGGDDLHAERRRAVAQHRRAHRSRRRHRRGERAPADAADARQTRRSGAPVAIASRSEPAGTAMRSAGSADRDRRSGAVTDAHASAGERWAASTISAAVSNGHARPSGLNGSCRLSPPAATTTPASSRARTAVSPRGVACWWSRPWR